MTIDMNTRPSRPNIIRYRIWFPKIIFQPKGLSRRSAGIPWAWQLELLLPCSWQTTCYTPIPRKSGCSHRGRNYRGRLSSLRYCGRCQGEYWTGNHCGYRDSPWKSTHRTQPLRRGYLSQQGLPWRVCMSGQWYTADETDTNFLHHDRGNPSQYISYPCGSKP